MSLCAVIKVHSLSVYLPISYLTVFSFSSPWPKIALSFSISFQSSLPGQLPNSILQPKYPETLLNSPLE